MDIYTKLASELTQLDAKDEARAIKRGERHNIYALSIMLGAAQEFETLAKSRTGYANHMEQAFAQNFNPSRALHGIANRLGLNLDVVRGQWILKDGAK